MSPKLKPLLLPQLVEERRKLEVQQNGSDGELTYVFLADSASSSSDIGSPVTPTFSSRSGHLRYSSSSSSIDLMAPSSSCSETPASPTQLAHSAKSSKRPLPDVQEDPLEREEEEETTLIPHPEELYDCLCKDPLFFPKALRREHMLTRRQRLQVMSLAPIATAMLTWPPAPSTLPAPTNSSTT